jgi:hypothetical protein
MVHAGDHCRGRSDHASGQWQETLEHVERQLGNRGGLIGLQLGDPRTVVEFRKIEIKELSATPLEAPAASPVSKSLTELRKIVVLRVDDLRTAQIRRVKGASTLTEAIQAEIAWLEAKLAVAEAENQPSAAVDLAKQLICRHEDLLKQVVQLELLGRIPQGEANTANIALSNARIRLAQLETRKPALGQAEAKQPPTPPIAGEWVSDFGNVVLKHDPLKGNQSVIVTGTWGGNPTSGGKITSGRYDPAARVLTLEYDDEVSKQKGSARLIVSDDGQVISGTFTHQPSGQSGSWTLVRVEKVSVP